MGVVGEGHRRCSRVKELELGGEQGEGACQEGIPQSELQVGVGVMRRSAWLWQTVIWPEVGGLES